MEKDGEGEPMGKDREGEPMGKDGEGEPQARFRRTPADVAPPL